MSLTELLPAVRSLPHPDKLRLLLFLANELARNENLPELQSGAEYPVWSPYDAHDAARTLQALLQTEEKPS